ncbi:transcriptional regulator, AraC family [Caloranaerobacter azorensis DSM 13643]|uniref:Transcriptional regulator, AraC family n=1 Tax=Caloranaerobacter azorensis DSM 13643 TaxID=1121264 RepID=A0A1M5S2N7_9FIRM|nr:AraC family transcriptional regulator [Caloranaerobacter azorensis]SHH32867.1 transcriptional regulator, AraC family [Caloranaerobacter azorensis DSM 13643]
MLTSFDRNLESIDGFETEYLRIFYYNFSDKYKDKYKSYEYNRLCTIIEGEKKVKVNNNQTFKYNSNQFILLPPYSSVEMEIDTPTKAVVLELNNNLIYDISNKISIDFKIETGKLIQNNLFISNNNNEIKKGISKIINLYNSSDKNKKFLIDLYAQEVIYNLFKIKGASLILNTEYKNPVYKAVKYMEENYNQPINIKNIAWNLNMSESNFSLYFKKIMGISPKDYLKNIRLSKAKELLKEHNVTEVAYSVGYENISHFIKLFKNKYGITPKQYKKTFYQKNLNLNNSYSNFSL